MPMPDAIDDFPGAESMPDEKVIQCIRSGQTSLYCVLMGRHSPRLFRAMRMILRNDAEAEDVVQEAHLRAVTCLHQFAGRSSFSTWLMQIALNEASTRRRRRLQFEPLQAAARPGEKTSEALLSAIRDPEQQALDGEYRKALERALKMLPEPYRGVFRLRAIEEVSTSEAARRLHLSKQSVKTRLHRARALLQQDFYARVGQRVHRNAGAPAPSLRASATRLRVA